MNMNKEVTYDWKWQVLLLIGALLINVMLVSGVKADGPLKEKDIEKQPYRMADLGGVEELTKAINAEEDLKRFKARMSSLKTKEIEKLHQEITREVNRMAISGGRR